MPRHILTIRSLGRDACWLLVQQAMGMHDAKTQSDFMEDRVAVLMFARFSLPERLCVTAAVRQMGGTTIFQADAANGVSEEVRDFQKHMMPILGYYIDCMYTYGFPIKEWRVEDEDLRFPVINAGSPEAHPSHALADIACMLRIKHELAGTRAAWIGCDNGTLYSLVECTAWFPFELAISLPPQADARHLKNRARELGTPIEFVDSPEMAARDADFLFAGKRGVPSAPEISIWSITPRLVEYAKPGAKLMLSASPLRAIPVDPAVMAGGRALLVRQAEYRLRVHKRMLHWVFQG